MCDSVIARGSGLIELVKSDETPTGDAYVLSDGAAEALRQEAAERADEACLN